MSGFDDISAAELSDILEDISKPDPQTQCVLGVRVAGNHDFAANALTPNRHLAYAKAKNDPNLKIGQFHLVVSSISKYNILAVEDVCVNYGVGEVDEDETLTAAERAHPSRCQIPNTEVRDLVALEPECNTDSNCVSWVCKFNTISARAVYGPSKGRKLRVCGTLKCRDSTDGTICLVQINVATVAIRVTTKESQAKGARKRKYESEVGPSAAENAANLAAYNLLGFASAATSASNETTPSASAFEQLMSRVAHLEEEVKRLSQKGGIVRI